MPRETSSRRLAAIVAIDVAGYSALSERDEEAAASYVARLRTHAHTVAIERSGRIFNTAGDGVMLEFSSASDALDAAIVLCEARYDPPLRFGLHLGEVVVAANGDLLGHEVNVAARLQAEAEPGGILVSQLVRDAVSNTLSSRLTARGRIKLPKIRETFSVFAWRSETTMAVAAAARAPVLAVLPFDTVQRTRAARSFADGVSEEILYAVSRLKGVKVIGSTSSFAFRGRDKPKAAQALNATHTIDGSVRREGDAARVSVQLSEAETGLVLWSQRYDRDVGDLFTLQEDIAAEVAQALALALGQSRRARTLKISPALFDAHLKAREHLKSGSPKRQAEAARMLEDIVRESPDFARGWSGLATARLEAMRLARGDRTQLAEDAREAAQRAIGLDDTIGEAFAVLAALESEFGRWREREQLLERALDAEPNNPQLLLRHGQFLFSIGRVSEAHAQQARAFELDPLDPTLAAFHGQNVWATRSKPEGRAILDKAAERHPENILVWYMRFNLAALDGEFALANALREEGLRLVPQLADSPIIRAGRMVQDLMAAPSPEAFMKLGEDFTAMAEAQPSSALDLAVALGVLGMGAPALALFEEALDDIDAWRQGAPQGLRPHVGYETALLFIAETASLRRETSFVRLCARLGLVAHWRETGHWPDCIKETPYDFRAACEAVS